MGWKSKEERNVYQRAYRLARGVRPRKFRQPGVCRFCGAVVVPPKIYCNLGCQGEARKREYTRRWLSGEVSGSNGVNLAAPVRRWLREQRGEACWKCGWAERHPVTDRVPVEVDQFDGNWRNNRPDNLRLLCPNCHSLTPTYRILNRGSGRPYTQVRLKDEAPVAQLDSAPAFSRKIARLLAGESRSRGRVGRVTVGRDPFIIASLRPAGLEPTPTPD